MSVERVKVSQELYHEARFNRKMLPDLAKAGPLSSSILFEARNPFAFLSKESREQTEDMKWGSMVDCLWLTPEDWDKYFLTTPKNAPRKPTPAQKDAYDKGTGSDSTAKSVEFWRKHELEAQTRTLLTGDQLEDVRAARNMLDSHPIARHIWEHSEKQVVLHGDLPFHCRVEGVKAKCMQDLWPVDGEIELDTGEVVPLNKCTVDLKQTHNTSQSGMDKAVGTFEYHMRLRFYQEMNKAYGQERPYAILIFQCSKFPFDVHIRYLTQQDLDEGYRIAQQRIDAMLNWDHRDLRPLYDLSVKPCRVPSYLKPDLDDE